MWLCDQTMARTPPTEPVFQMRFEQSLSCISKNLSSGDQHENGVSPRLPNSPSNRVVGGGSVGRSVGGSVGGKAVVDDHRSNPPRPRGFQS